MSLYRYKAVDADGQMLYGEIDAPNRDAAITRLQGSGYLPVSAEEVGGKRNVLGDLLARLRRPGTPDSGDIIIFTRELATLLEAGLPLDAALETLANVSNPGPVQDLINAIHQRVRAGVSLSDAMADQGGVFSRLYLNMVRAGEAGGSLHTIIDRMADYLERMGELRSAVITALIYPAILVVIALISLAVLMTFVVPGFIPLFEDAGETLPLVTRMVFAVAGLFQHYWWVLLVLVTSGVWLAHRRLEIPEQRLRFDTWVLGVPRIGELIAQMEIARFTRSLGTLLINGVPVLSAVALVRDVLTNQAIARTMDAVVDSLQRGQRMARPLRQVQYFPSLAVQLIEVGEESGQLESMLMKIAEIYDKEVQLSVKRMLTLLEPVIIVGLGVLIAVIIFSILIPIINLNQLVI